MRMTKKGFKDSARGYRTGKPRDHDGHIGPGPKPGPKRAVNLSIDAEILALAKEMGVNLSQTLEDALRKLTQDERIRRFREEHRAFFESYNAYLARNGTLTEALLAEQGETLDSDDPSV